MNVVRGVRLVWYGEVSVVMGGELGEVNVVRGVR